MHQFSPISSQPVKAYGGVVSSHADNISATGKADGVLGGVHLTMVAFFRAKSA